LFLLVAASILVSALLASAGGASPARSDRWSGLPGLAVSGSTQSSISISWLASHDLGVMGYHVYVSGAQAGTTQLTSWTFTGLTCGRSYVLAAGAYTAAGALSTSTISASTRSCSTDTTPPSKPLNLAQTGATQTSVTVAWSASTDNVGVAGYHVYVGLTMVGSTASTSYTLSGRSCGTSIVVVVAAYDAAGNLSPKSAVGAKTTACAPSGGTGGTGSGSSSALYVAPNGSDANACTQGAPCLSFNRAYQLAAPGASVTVSAGQYAAQTIKSSAGKLSGPDVVFQPAAGAVVAVARLTILGSHIQLTNMNFPYDVGAGASNITLRNINADAAISVAGASNVSVIGGQVYSPVPTASDSQVASYGGFVPTNILFDGVYFHDFADTCQTSTCVSNHIECLQVGAANGLTIRNSRFQRCWSHDIFIRSWGYMNNSPSPIKNVLIENNWFAPTTVGYYSIQLLDDLASAYAPSSALLRNNTALQGWNIHLQYGTQQVVGNILPAMDSWACSTTGAGYDYNLYMSGTPCGPHDQVGNPMLVSPGTFDYDLLPGSAAINAGDPFNYPSTDIHGTGRPLGGLPDAGAVEAG
jgi:chitodextrinase